jgi:hypothetical protein
MGYTGHNFSVGGGGFTPGNGTGPGSFAGMVQAAVADTSYDHNAVEFFFVVDMGNDIRALASVAPYADAVFSAIRQGFPNAQIILLPVLWGDAPSNATNAGGNNVGGRILSIRDRLQEAENAGLPYGVRIVPWSWTWMADARGLDWMRPGEVHYTAEGYTRVANFMRTYMLGGDTKYDVGWYNIPPAAAVNPNYAYWQASRDGNTARIQSSIALAAAVPVDTNLGQLAYGTWPIATQYVDVVSQDYRTPYTVSIYPTGLIRSFGPMPAGTYLFDVDFDVF